MAQAKKKTATKTAKKQAGQKAMRSGARCGKCQKEQKSNMFFVISMSFLAATLLFANLLLLTV